MSVAFAVWFFGSVAVGVQQVHQRREEYRARMHFASYHGEAIPFETLRGRSGTFIAEMIRLECARLESKERARLAAIVHLYHPLTPFQWFCGDRTDGGHGDMGFEPARLTCPACIARKSTYDLLVDARRGADWPRA